jgi:hypothetical protein
LKLKNNFKTNQIPYSSFDRKSETIMAPANGDSKINRR